MPFPYPEARFNRRISHSLVTFFRKSVGTRHCRLLFSSRPTLIKFCYHKLSKQLVKKVKFMVQTIQARNITLYDLETTFGIQLVEDENFFREWQDNLPEITDTEKQRLDRVKASFANLLKYPPLLENTVKMVVLSPLWDLADFYLSPFHRRTRRKPLDERHGEEVGSGFNRLQYFFWYWLFCRHT